MEGITEDYYTSENSQLASPTPTHTANDPQMLINEHSQRKLVSSTATNSHIHSDASSKERRVGMTIICDKTTI